MIAPLSFILLGSAALGVAVPLTSRTVTSLDQAAFAEAQQRDNTATRAFSSTQIKTSDGKCLFVDELSGDFRANLTPVQVVTCDANSAGQKFDVITAGKHQNVAGQALIVSSLTQACLNFDGRRAAGNQVILFSCGGRADGGGAVTDSQQFAFAGGADPLTLTPKNSPGTCITVKGNVLDQASCNNAATQSFTIGAGGGAAAATTKAAAATKATTKAAATTTQAAVATSPADTEDCELTTSIITVTANPINTANNAVQTDCAAPVTVTETQFVTVTAGSAAAVTTAVAATVTKAAATTKAAAATTNAAAAATNTVLSVNPTTPVPVARAGGVLQPAAAAEANTRDDTATRAFSGVSLQSADGQCLFIDPVAGDFRQELIPVQLQPCTGSPNEKFDIITAGKHNNAANSMLIVSTLMQGCLNFDDRRAVGDKVLMFSCGGRADGQGGTTDSQLFPTTTLASKKILLAPENSKGSICLVKNGGLLDSATCTGGADQLFTIV